MIAYISFAADTTQEQNLLSSSAIGTSAYTHARAIIDKTSGLEYGKVLSGHEYPFLIAIGDLEYSLLPFWERFLGEQKVICESTDNAALWKIVIRPLQGRVSLGRLRFFCEQLSKIERTANNKDTIDHVVSVVPYLTGAHPLWGSIATDHCLHDGTSIRMTVFGRPHEKRSWDIYERMEDGFDKKIFFGSQDVQELYYYDNALCAFRGNISDLMNNVQDQPTPVYTDMEQYLDGLPPFFLLPIFEINHNTSIMIDNIEKVALL